MSLQYSVALVGDYNPSVPAHQAIPLALALASAHHGVKINANWVPSSQIQNAEAELASYQGIWCVPASPYENMQGALDAIRLVRERGHKFDNSNRIVANPNTPQTVGVIDIAKARSGALAFIATIQTGA